MANALFDSGRAGYLDGTLAWDTDAIHCTLIDHADDTPVPSTDDFYDDIAAAARVGDFGPLTSKTTTAGVADAADITDTAVSGDQCESIVGYENDATDATSSLIFFIDTATGLPVTPGGGDITIQWDAGANRIFKL